MSYRSCLCFLHYGTHHCVSRGFAPGQKPGVSSGPGTGANAVGIPTKPGEAAEKETEKEEKRRRKEERRREKEEKRARKEARRAERHTRKHTPGDDERDDYSNRHMHRTQSRSPRRKSRDEERGRNRAHSSSRSRSPPPRRPVMDYGEREREREGPGSAALGGQRKAGPAQWGFVGAKLNVALQCDADA